jgi:hypothetical protein
MPADPKVPQALADARALWCGRYQGVLSTMSTAEPGYPFGSVVPLCLSNVGEPLLLLSHLAQHSRNVEADPRCALTLFDPVEGDVQQGRRLTCMGRCQPLDDADALARYCRHFPRGTVYARELGFRLYGFIPERAYYNGGFATARWLGVDRLLDGAALPARVEDRLRQLVQDAHQPWLRARWPGPGGDRLLVAGVDPIGLTLRRGDQLLRLEVAAPLANETDLRAAIAAERFRLFGSATGAEEGDGSDAPTGDKVD